MTSRHKKKRGRAPNLGARRRQTTRAGRRGEIVPLDGGSARLLFLRASVTGQTSLPADPLGVLLGRELIEPRDYNAGRQIGELFAQLRAPLGLSNGSAQGMWLAILAGVSLRGSLREGDGDMRLAHRARRLLLAISERIDNAAITELTFAVGDGVWRPRGSSFIVSAALGQPLKIGELTQLTNLRFGLGETAKVWDTGAHARN